MKDEIIFIQVGSNEGVMATDPLSHFILKDKWKGILIEPVPYIFEKLKKNYEGRSDLFFENVAISSERKTTEFFIIDGSAEFFQKNPGLMNEDGGAWGDQLGSLDLNHVLKCRPMLTKTEVKSIKVECVTLQDIVDKYQLKRVDVIQIDAEGHDDVILFSIDFSKIQPKIIMFEHMHMTLERYMECTSYLQEHGYSVVCTNPSDTVVSRL
jgi:FkbM family methyltransferase